MIKVSVLYPCEEGKKFDMEYYCNKHIPMFRQKFGPACKRVDVDEGMRGATTGSKPLYIAMAHLYFDSMEAYQAASLPHAEAARLDTPNYTDIQPIVQVSEVKL